MAHARGKHRPLRGTPETTCHPAQARVGSLTDGLSARCRTPNDVHRRRRGRNTWLDRGGAAVADCRGRRPHAPLSPLFPAPNLPAFPPPAKHVQPGGHDSRHPARLTRSSPVGSIQRAKPARSNQARVPAAKPYLNRCFAATFPVSPRFGMLSSLCRPQGRRAALDARALRCSQVHPARISPGRFFRGAAMAGARTGRQGRGDLGKQGIPASPRAGFSMQFL
jgi:hypothetical protein